MQRRNLPIAGESPRFVETSYSPDRLVAIAGELAREIAPLVKKGPEGALEAAERANEAAQKILGEAMEREPPEAQIACRRGCSTCCQAKVLVVAPEVLRIGAFLRKNLTAEALEALLARVREADEETRGLSRAARAEAHVPCPLLDEQGGCSVHEVRPLVCRSWTSFDAAACERYWEAPTGKLTPPQWAIGYELAQVALAGLGKACFDAGRDGTPLEFIAALRIALERPSAGERWHKRLPVFSAARDEEWVRTNGSDRG